MSRHTQQESKVKQEPCELPPLVLVEVVPSLSVTSAVRDVVSVRLLGMR